MQTTSRGRFVFVINQMKTSTRSAIPARIY